MNREFEYQSCPKQNVRPYNRVPNILPLPIHPIRQAAMQLYAAPGLHAGVNCAQGRAFAPELRF